MSLFEMREMRDLCVVSQSKLELSVRDCTDPINSDMAVNCGYQNGSERKNRLQ